MRDRAAAGADLDQLDGRDLHRQAGAAQEALLARRLEAIGDQRLAVVDQRELGRRAAHVEGEHALQSGVAAEPGAGQRAGRRAAFEQLHRRALGLAHMGEAAVRQHQEQAAGNALGAQRLLEPLEIDLGQRPDVGVGHRRRRAQVLADLRRDVGRQRDRQILVALGDRRADRALVRRVGVGMQEADGEALDALLDQLGDLGQRGIDIERLLDRAVGRQPLHRLAPPRPRHQRLGHLDEQVVELVLALAADLQHVAEARRGEQPGLRALALDQRVGEQRRGMHHAADLLGLRARLLQHPPRAFERTARRIVGRRALLPDDGAAVARIVDDEVGEGAPDIDAEGERRIH